VNTIIPKVLLEAQPSPAPATAAAAAAPADHCSSKWQQHSTYFAGCSTGWSLLDEVSLVGATSAWV